MRDRKAVGHRAAMLAAFLFLTATSLCMCVPDDNFSTPPHSLAEQRTIESESGGHAETLARVRSRLVPVHTLFLSEPSLVAFHRHESGNWGDRDTQEVVPLMGPHLTRQPPPAVPEGRFMVLQRPAGWTSVSGCVGRPPLVCVSEAFEETLVANGITDVHHLDEAHIIAYVPSALLRVGDGEPAEGTHAPVTVFDVFGVRTGGHRLKLSHDIRRRLDGQFSSTAQAGDPAALRLGVWTVHGAADALRREVEALVAHRHHRRHSSVPESFGDQDVDANSAPRRCSSALHSVPCAAGGSKACADHFVLTLSSPHDSAPLLDALVASCRHVILSIVAHPWVRWVEPLAGGADAANINAVSFVQNSSALDASFPMGSHDWLLAHPAWAAGINGSGEIVAIVDSGVDVDSCFFHDPNYPSVAFYPHSNPYHRKVLSYLRAQCEGSTTADASDSAGGHGTHVAGSAVGYVVEPAAVSHYNGLATGAMLFVHDLGCPESPKLQLPSNFRDVFEPSYLIGARISCNSWGVESQPTYSAMERTVDQYLFEHDDMLAVFASGNVPKAGLTRPGRTKNVLTVGSHRNIAGPHQSDVSAFSAHGPTYDQRQKPDVVAPGESIQSAYSDGLAGSFQCATSKKQGTSMSAAIVAGGAALVRQFFRQRQGVPLPSSALVKGAIIHSTHFLPSVSARSGFGQVDLSLLTHTQPAPTRSGTTSAGRAGDEDASTPDARLWFRDREPIAHLESHAFCFSAAAPRQLTEDDTVSQQGDTHRNHPGALPGVGTTSIKVTLVWTDVGSGAEGSNRSLVHDLDLVLVDTLGQLYYSHDRANPQERGFDRTNNVEQIELPMTRILSEGFRVFVYGASVLTRASQPYALVVTAPGLVFYDDFASLMAEVDRRRQRFAAALLPTVAMCPGNCSDARGRCDTGTGQCSCVRVYQFIDCSQCNARVLCGGRGTCDDASLTCTCDPHGHFQSTSDCRTCQRGWFGENCDFDCQCKNSGRCDETHGRCECPQDRRVGGAGCFQGPRCEHCCPGFGGPGCRERSHWCNASGALVEIDGGESALIQVDGSERYQASMTCRWRIRAPPDHRVSLEVIKMDLETGFDFLNIYDTRDTTSEGGQSYLIHRYTGSPAVLTGVVSSSRTLDAVFVSDWEGTASGFVIRYGFLPVEQPAVCHVQCGAASGDAMLDASAENRVCGVALGLDELCVCRRGFMGFHCEHTVNDTLMAVPCAEPAWSFTHALPATATTHAAPHTPKAADRGAVAHTSLELLGALPAGDPVLGTQSVTLTAAQTSVRLPLGVNAPSELDLSVTLTGTGTPQSANLYEQQVRVHLTFLSMSLPADGACSEETQPSPWPVHLPLGDLPGLALAASVRDAKHSLARRPAQLLSLYQCGTSTVSPSLSLVLSSPTLHSMGSSDRVQLTFSTRVSVMLVWNASRAVPARVRRLPSVVDMAVVPSGVEWLDVNVRGTTPEVDTTHAVLLPWHCGDKPFRATDSFAALLHERVNEFVTPTASVEPESNFVTSRQVALCGFVGVACGVALTLVPQHVRRARQRPLALRTDELSDPENCEMSVFSTTVTGGAPTKSATPV